MKFLTDISLSTLHCILPIQVDVYDDYWRYALVLVVLQVEAVVVPQHI